MRARWLEENALDLVQADLVAAAVVELGRAGRGLVGDHRRLLQCAAIFRQAVAAPIRAVTAAVRGKQCSVFKPLQPSTYQK